MFATSAAPRTAFAHHASAYRQVGVETGISSASPHQLVLMLFDAYVDSLAQARGAMRAGQIELKCRSIGRAIRIVSEGLRTGLNLRDGGELAADLNDLYGYIGQRLTHANAHSDEAALDECLRLIQPLRQAWAAIAPRHP